MAVWQRFHKDIKDLTLWINNAEKIIRETKQPTGDLDIDKAKQEQGVGIKLMFFIRTPIVRSPFKKYPRI